VTVNLRNVSGEPLNLGRPDGRLVDVDEVIHVEGDVSKDSPDDAYVIGDGDDARAYPKSLWSNAGGSPNSTPDVPAPSEETA
jgi:hypothetical protein